MLICLPASDATKVYAAVWVLAGIFGNVWLAAKVKSPLKGDSSFVLLRYHLVF